jgi:predicted Zn-dependent protease
MKKTLLQGILTVLLFFGTWYCLRQIDWVAVFRIQKMTDKTEKKLGDLFWDVFKKSGKENKNEFVKHAVDSIVTRLCISNNIDKNKLKIHVLDKDDVNAFALPNCHLVVYSGLITNADNAEEVAGVIGHELAHIELNHVMKKLIKEIGLTVLITMTTGGGSGETIKEAAKTLSSSAFDRELEKEADLKAVEYLVRAKVNPSCFANFMFKITDKENEAFKYPTWMSTHPDSKQRAAYILAESKKSPVSFRPVLATTTWEKLQKELKED